MAAGKDMHVERWHDIGAPRPQDRPGLWRLEGEALAMLRHKVRRAGLIE
jgi:hypothetical protein